VLRAELGEQRQERENTGILREAQNDGERRGDRVGVDAVGCGVASKGVGS